MACRLSTVIVPEWGSFQIVDSQYCYSGMCVLRFSHANCCLTFHTWVNYRVSKYETGRSIVTHGQQSVLSMPYSFHYLLMVRVQ